MAELAQLPGAMLLPDGDAALVALAIREPVVAARNRAMCQAGGHLDPADGFGSCGEKQAHNRDECPHQGDAEDCKAAKARPMREALGNSPDKTARAKSPSTMIAG